MNQTLAILVCFFIVGFWLAFFFLIPQIMTSLYRYHLWKLRDEVVDDVALCLLPENPAVTAFISRTEQTIQNADLVSLRHFLLISPFRGRVEEDSDEILPNPEQQARLTGYRYRYALINAKHLFHGTPLGWFALTVAIPIVLISSAIQMQVRFSASMIALAKRVIDVENLPIDNANKSNGLSGCAA